MEEKGYISIERHVTILKEQRKEFLDLLHANRKDLTKTSIIAIVTVSFWWAITIMYAVAH